MPQITNNTRETIAFHTGGTRDNPEFTSIAPGETESVSVNPENVQFKAAVFVGAVTVDGSAPASGRRRSTKPAPDSE